MSGLSVVLQLLQAGATTFSAVQSMRGGTAAAGAGEELARQLERQGEAEAAALRTAAVRRRGIVRRAAAAAGFDPNRGTPAQVAAENAWLDELDVQHALFSARTRAKRSRREADAARSAGFLTGAQTLVGGLYPVLSRLGPRPQSSLRPPPKPIQPLAGEPGFLEDFERTV